MLPAVLGIGALFSSVEYLYDAIAAGDGNAKLADGIGARSTILTSQSKTASSSSSKEMSLL